MVQWQGTHEENSAHHSKGFPSCAGREKIESAPLIGDSGDFANGISKIRLGGK
jgi:hypothetical protein